jgi:hypothetical protein
LDCNIKGRAKNKGKKVLGPKADEMVGDCRELHNEELNNLQSSQTVIRMIKPREMRLAGHTACTGTREVHTRF